jgi:uncharacterized membrane protein
MAPAEQHHLRRIDRRRRVHGAAIPDSNLARPDRRICIVAFAVAIPLLAALILINRQEAFRHRRSRSTLVATAQVVAQVCAFIGVVAGFWHILWIAGVAVLASGLIGVLIHSGGYWRLERDQPPAR